MNFVLFLNGKRAEESLAAQKAFAQSAGVFESLRTYHGKFFRLKDHLKRFRESAQTVGVKDQINFRKIEQDLLKTLKVLNAQKEAQGKDYFFRVTWWQSGIYVMAGERRHPNNLYRKGVALKTSPVRRSPQHAVPAGAKTTDYVNALMATLEPNPDSVYEWVFLDAQGFMTEVRIGNFFMIKDGRLLTPPALSLLNGVTRRFVIECAQDLKIPVREIPITRHEVYNADEAFLTNTSWEILPVRELDCRKIGTLLPGRMTQQLQQTFKNKVLRECR